MRNCIVFFYFLSFLDFFLPCTRSVEHVFVESHVLLFLNVFLNTLLADVFLRIDVKISLNAIDVTSVAGTQVH